MTQTPVCQTGECQIVGYDYVRDALGNIIDYQFTDYRCATLVTLRVKMALLALAAMKKYACGIKIQ